MFKLLIASTIVSMTLISCENFDAPADMEFRIGKTDGNIVEVREVNGLVKHAPSIAVMEGAPWVIASEAEHRSIAFTVVDPDNDVQQLEVYVDGNLMSTDTTAPYTFETQSLAEDGTYQIVGKITDAQGMSATSTMSQVIISLNSNPNTIGMKKIPIRMGDRHYVGNFLENIFGKSNPHWDNIDQYSNPNDMRQARFPFGGNSDGGYMGDPVNEDAKHLIENYVYRNVSAFGGVCEHNRRITTGGRYQRDYPAKDRNGGRSTGIANNIPEWRRENCRGANSDNTTRLKREAALFTVCEEISKRDIAMQRALDKVGGNFSSAPTPAQVEGIFKLFYPFMEYENDIRDSLNSVLATQSTPKEKWKILVGGVCQTAYWQVMD